MQFSPTVYKQSISRTDITLLDAASLFILSLGWRAITKWKPADAEERQLLNYYLFGWERSLYRGFKSEVHHGVTLLVQPYDRSLAASVF